MGTPLETNTIELQEILSKINALPDGGSEDLSSEITEYSNLNTELEETIDGLPTAGGGGSGGAVETCTVTFEYQGKAYTSGFGYSYMAVVDGEIQNVFSFGTTAGNNLGTIENMLCGSYLYVYTQQFDLTATSTGDIEVIYIGDLFDTYTGVSVFRMPRTAGDTATVSIELVT